MDDDTHVSNVVEFQEMIDELKRHNTLAGRCFDKRMAAQAKQLKFLVEKTKVMSEYAQVVIDVIDERL